MTEIQFYTNTQCLYIKDADAALIVLTAYVDVCACMCSYVPENLQTVGKLIHTLVCALQHSAESYLYLLLHCYFTFLVCDTIKYIKNSDISIEQTQS